MKKVVVGLGVVLVALAVVLIGAAYWSGQQAERWYRQILADHAQQSGLQISLTSYKRGWLTSTATTRYEVNPANAPGLAAVEADQLAFETHETLYHGPLPLAAWGLPGVSMAPAAAVVRQTLVSESSPWTRKLAEWYGNQEPLLVVTRVGFDRSSTSHVTMPPLTLKEVAPLQSLDFSGLNGQFYLAAGGTALQGDMAIDRFEAVAPTDTDPSKVQRLTLREVRASADQKQGQNPFGLVLGDTHFQLGEIRLEETAADATATVSALLNQVRIETTGKVSPQNPQQVEGAVTMQVEQATLGPWSGTGSIQLMFNRLDGATLGQMQQRRETMGLNTNDPQLIQREAEALLTLARNLLRGEPELKIETQGRVTQGNWQGQLSLKFQDYAGDADLAQNPVVLLSALREGTLDVTVAKTLAELLLAHQLTTLVTSGFVQLQGDQYQTQARFANGRLSVNGQELPLGLPSGRSGDAVTPEPDGGAGPAVEPLAPSTSGQ